MTSQKHLYVNTDTCNHKLMEGNFFSVLLLLTKGYFCVCQLQLCYLCIRRAANLKNRHKYDKVMIVYFYSNCIVDSKDLGGFECSLVFSLFLIHCLSEQNKFHQVGREVLTIRNRYFGVHNVQALSTKYSGLQYIFSLKNIPDNNLIY